MPYPRAASTASPLIAAPLSHALQPLRQAIANQVIGVFNDQAKGERPVKRQPDGLFGPRSVAWRVHGDVAGMMVGGVTGLMLQMLHPSVLGGVWDHSKFRTDLHGRLRRTARFIALTTYGGRDEAEAVIARVRRIHDHVGGKLQDGTVYSANDPALLAWVHVTETTSFLGGWLRYVEPCMSRSDQDRYHAEMAEIGRALGADPVPSSRASAETLIRSMRPALRYDDRVREVSHYLLHQRPENPLARPLQTLTMKAALDLLPIWARRMHRLPSVTLDQPLVRASMLGVARTLRWAFA